jgi:hypothetical protein
MDSLDGYGSMWILKETVERTCVADKAKVGEMIHSMDIKDGAAMALSGAGQIRCGRTPRRRATCHRAVAKRAYQSGLSGRPRSSGGKVAKVGLKQRFPPPHQHS